MLAIVRWIAAQLAAALVRTAFTIAIGAIIIFFGLAPQTWFAGIISHPPNWLTSPLTRLAVIVLGFLCITAVHLIPRLVPKQGDNIRIVIGNGEEFERARAEIYSIKRTKGIVLENASPVRSVDGCKVALIGLEPYAGHRLPKLFIEGVTLHPSERHFVPIVTYNEPEGSVSGDNIMMVETKSETAKDDGRIPVDLDIVLSLKVTARDTQTRTAKCRAYVSQRALHFEAL
jgi:hypothetical protein